MLGGKQLNAEVAAIHQDQRYRRFAVQLLNEIGVSTQTQRLFRRAADSKDVGQFPIALAVEPGKPESGCEAQGWKSLGSLLFGPLSKAQPATTCQRKHTR